jgi:hypothetical protein
VAEVVSSSLAYFISKTAHAEHCQQRKPMLAAELRGQVVSIPACVWEVRGRNFGPELCRPEVFRIFPHSLLNSVGTVPQTRPRPLPSNSLLINHPIIRQCTV